MFENFKDSIRLEGYLFGLMMWVRSTMWVKIVNRRERYMLGGRWKDVQSYP